MKLKTWLKENNVRQRELAHQLEISEPFVSDLCNGKRLPALGTLVAIERATNGAVTATDFLDADTE